MLINKQYVRSKVMEGDDISLSSKGGSSLYEPALHSRPLLGIELPNLVPDLLGEHSGPSLLSVAAHPCLTPLVVSSKWMSS